MEQKYTPPWDKTTFKPWGLQTSLKEQRIPTEQDIKVISANIQNLRTQALFIMLYLTAGRVTEICNELKKQDIELKFQKGRYVMLIKMINRKHRKRHWKDIPIPLDREGVLIKMLNQYLKTKHTQDILFPFGKIRAYQLIRGATGFNNHWIRHLRLTHLVLNYDFNEQLLVRFAGWTNSLPAKEYMELRWTDILDKYD
jgi:integrase